MPLKTKTEVKAAIISHSACAAFRNRVHLTKADLVKWCLKSVMRGGSRRERIDTNYLMDNPPKPLLKLNQESRVKIRSKIRYATLKSNAIKCSFSKSFLSFRSSTLNSTLCFTLWCAAVCEPLFVVQLRELAEEFDVQYWVVSFTGYSGARQARDDISAFVAACVSIHQLPFCGFRLTKTPIGPQGKAAIVPELRIQLFVDDRADIVNEVKRTGIQVHLATGDSTVWINDLLAFFRSNNVNSIRAIVATPLQKHQFSKEPPGRRGY